MRLDGRQDDMLRPIRVQTGVNKYAEGSAWIEVGDTQVLTTVTIEDKVPSFLRGQGRGWLTAEYSMLPRATETRNVREVMKGRTSGRTMEIQRLIGRSLRSVVDFTAIGERTFIVDCDVIQADGGTRTASITGGFIALAMALSTLSERLGIAVPVKDFVAATSVGIVDGRMMIDLTYAEDSRAAVDLNVVMTGSGDFVEIQGTGEEATFSYAQLTSMLALIAARMNDIFEVQRQALGAVAKHLDRQRSTKDQAKE